MLKQEFYVKLKMEDEEELKKVRSIHSTFHENNTELRLVIATRGY